MQDEGKIVEKVEKKEIITTEFVQGAQEGMREGTRAQVVQGVKPVIHRQMMACRFSGKLRLKCVEIPLPKIDSPTDVIVRVTASSVGGSDLMLYLGEIASEFKRDFTMGHEGIGIIEEVGPEVKNLKKGDRVIISSIIACGSCQYCKKGEFSCCDVTNRSSTQKRLEGINTSAVLGFSDIYGGLDGCHADYVRVPFGDVNCFKVPQELDDKKALLVSDILCTAYNGCELGQVKAGDNVIVFGCGPVGLLTMMFAVVKGAKNVIGIDIDEYRLQFAKEKFKVNVISAKTHHPVHEVLRLLPEGADVVIDCVGAKVPESLVHKLSRVVGLEPSPVSILNDGLEMLKKNGIFVVLGDYSGTNEKLNLGMLMDKHLTIKGGIVWPQRYYQDVINLMLNRTIDPSVVFTHTFPLSRIEEAYKKLSIHEDGVIKPLILPDIVFNSLGTL